MQPFAFYPVFVGTVLSIIGNTLLARREYNSGEAKTLSQLGGGHSKALRQFRAILWVCGTLFGITMLFFIAPRLNSQSMYVILTVTYACEILLGVVPDHPGPKHLWHGIFAYGMALGFLITSIFFALRLDNIYQIISIILLLAMIMMVVIAGFNKKRFLFYQLSYIYLSHISIVIAALALR
jgi:hypothetical protein